MKSTPYILILLLLCISGAILAQESAELQDAKTWVNQASQLNETWTGPQTGPSAEKNKFIVYIGKDLLNGGIFQVSVGVEEAAAAIGWDLLILDGYGKIDSLHDAFQTALEFQPDGIIVAGPAKDVIDEIQMASDLGIPVVGWHAIANSGPDEDGLLFTNVTTNPLEVAKIAAYYAIVDSDSTAGVVIFTTSEADIALEKSDEMAKIIQSCETCQLLEIVDIPLASTPTAMEDVIIRLWNEYGDTWTHSLAINDLYYDFSGQTFEQLGITSQSAPASISAGDGSQSAFRRIHDGEYQVATVPEPLNLQGWQLIDELNRAFAQEEHSHYVAPVHLIIQSSITGTTSFYDPNNDYRNIYLSIWGNEAE